MLSSSGVSYIKLFQEGTVVFDKRDVLLWKMVAERLRMINSEEEETEEESLSKKVKQEWTKIQLAERNEILQSKVFLDNKIFHITYQEMCTLLPNKCLNTDIVISVLQFWINTRCSPLTKMKFLLLGPTFFQQVDLKMLPQMRILLRKMAVFVLYNDGHFSVAAVLHCDQLLNWFSGETVPVSHEPRILYLDSIYGSFNKPGVEQVQEYLFEKTLAETEDLVPAEENSDNAGEPTRAVHHTKQAKQKMKQRPLPVHNIPVPESNFNDCGIFAILNVQELLTRMPATHQGFTLADAYSEDVESVRLDLIRDFIRAKLVSETTHNVTSKRPTVAAETLNVNNEQIQAIDVMEVEEAI